MTDSVPDPPQSEDDAGSKILSNAVTAAISSGFPFQLAVADRIASLSSVSTFVVGEEVPWRSVDVDARGTLDVVADSNSAIFCAIECKAVRNGERQLTFIRSANEERMNWSPILFRELGSDAGRYTMVQLKGMKIESESAAFVLEKVDNLQLEALAAEVTLAAEALCDGSLFRFQGRRSYFLPVIVTNCPLIICDFDPSNVDLKTRHLDGSLVKSKSVPFVRFQKSLGSVQRTTEYPGMLWHLVRKPSSRGYEISGALAAFDRCVWVVNASELESFFRMVLNLGFSLPTSA